MAERIDRETDDWEPDEEWKPPTEAEMKVLQAKRERSDKISKLMGDYLLKGYKMLGTSCADCGTILLRTKGGVDYCVACKELDSDAVKDDPALSREAARSQAAEQQQRNGSEEAATEPALAFSQSPTHGAQSVGGNSSVLRQPHFSSTENALGSSNGDILNLDSSGDGAQSSVAPSLRPVIRSADTIPGSKFGSVSDSIHTVQQKLQWATAELAACSSVEYSMQLCQLIKSCADTIRALNNIEAKCDQ